MTKLPLPVLSLLILTAAHAQTPERILDLADVSLDDGVLRRIYGATGTGSFGLPVAGGPDCDGDGFGDVAVAFMTASPFGRFYGGEVDLIFGDGTLSGFVDTAAADPRVLRFAGAARRETAGSEIWIDDVTGDGLGDLLISRQNHTPDAGRIGAGALTVVAGGPELRAQAMSLTTVDLAAPPAALRLTTFVGAAELDRLGIWARTGDVDGDGVADIVVGADQEDLGAEINRGAVYVIRGGGHLEGGGTIDLSDFGATPLEGHLAKITPPPGADGYHLGATCQVADLDGNGRAEVLAAAALARAGAGIEADGAPAGSAEASGGAPDGRVYIAWDDNFPTPPWPAGYSFAISSSPGSRTAIRGENRNAYFGEEILGGRDYDGDGNADLFVGDLIADGTAAQDRPLSGLGHVFFTAAELSGLDFDLDTPPGSLTLSRILGPEAHGLGADTAAEGDFDGDGFDDLAFASPHGSPAGREVAGIVHLLYGKEGAWPATVDLATGSLPPAGDLRVAEIRGARGTMGADTGDTLGYSAAGGDVDGDGLDDLIVNEMVGNGLDPGAIDVGNLLVVNGIALGGEKIFADGFESGDTSSWSSTSATRSPLPGTVAPRAIAWRSGDEDKRLKPTRRETCR